MCTNDYAKLIEAMADTKKIELAQRRIEKKASRASSSSQISIGLIKYESLPWSLVASSSKSSPVLGKRFLHQGGTLFSQPRKMALVQTLPKTREE